MLSYRLLLSIIVAIDRLKPTARASSDRQEHELGRILKYLFFLVVLGLLGMAGYALFSELPPPTEQVVEPVDTNLSK